MFVEKLLYEMFKEYMGLKIKKLKEKVVGFFGIIIVVGYVVKYMKVG